MTPRLPAKRRSKEDGNRPAKKANEEETYDTYDDAMEGGVEMEEKGERFKDGEKAQRFYEKARDLYQKAMQFDSKAFDAIYNLARVQYILGTQFALPPHNLELITSATALYQQAMEATSNPRFKNNAAFNLAQALASFADLTDEIDGPEGAADARELRKNAIKMLTPVLTTQFMWVQGMGQTPDEGMEVDAEEGGPDLGNQPTADSLVDTALLVVDLGSTLWETATPTQLPGDGEQASTREMLESVRSMAPEGRQAEIDLAEIKALLTYDSIGWELGRAEVQANTPVERPPAIKALERLLESLDAQPAADSTVKSDILMTIANTQLEYAQRYVLLASKFAENAPAYGAGAWAQLSAAAGHLNAAAKLPRTAATPAEFLPNCYIELLKSTLMRARLATIHEPALRNAQALFDNCAAYGAKAAEALKWNYPRLPSSKTGMTPLFSDSLSVPSPAGWDMEMLARDLALNLLRVCFFAKTETILTETGTAAMYEMAAKSLVDSLKSIREDPRRLGPRDIRRFVGDIEDSEGALSPEEVAWWKEVEEGLHVVEDTSAAAQQVNAMFG